MICSSRNSERRLSSVFGALWSIFVAMWGGVKVLMLLLLLLLPLLLLMVSAKECRIERLEREMWSSMSALGASPGYADIWISGAGLLG